MTTANGNQPIGFIGLGELGAPIARNLLSAGKTLKVWNRTASKAEPLLQLGATLARRPSDTIARGGIVFTIVWDDESLEAIVHSEGFLEALAGGGIHVSMTTITPQTAQKLAALHQAHGSTYVESPIFGVPPQAVARQLTVCLGGPQAAKERVRPLLEAMGGQRIFDFGESVGAATATKLVGNYLLFLTFAAMSEAHGVLTASGIDPKPTLEMLTTTVLATVPNQRYAGYLISGVNPIATSGIPQKDAGLFNRFADAANVPVPIARQLRALITPAARPNGA